MNTIHIEASKPYDVIIGKDLDMGQLLESAVSPCRTVLVSDSNVPLKYRQKVVRSIRNCGFDVCTMVIPAGEESKNMETLEGLLEYMADCGLTRTDCVIALGGGVVGDLTGFAAGCYLRGIKYVQMPTTLLAAVDSSVGGKTAIDLMAGKNLAGLFYQPEVVLCDVSFLDSLPEDVFACGLAEAIKTGVLSGHELFDRFSRPDIKENIAEIISLCVRYKGDVVQRDEFETGERKLLNLGHTIGHAIEKLSGYEIAHGQAVAMGMAMMARSAEAMGDAPEGMAETIEKVLTANGLPTDCEYSAGQLAQFALNDKKRTGDEITIVIPAAIGECTLKKLPVSELKDYISAGISK
ncbi:MAG: 3-dehydroquinate synthase [Ruminococcaceae bacterium]|nr:3-dehydroquinate synthase [Oscillospiraceae bacterium]